MVIALALALVMKSEYSRFVLSAGLKALVPLMTVPAPALAPTVMMSPKLLNRLAPLTVRLPEPWKSTMSRPASPVKLTGTLTPERIVSTSPPDPPLAVIEVTLSKICSRPAKITRSLSPATVPADTNSTI